jgi:uncharacterized protein (DUF2252 family)
MFTTMPSLSSVSQRIEAFHKDLPADGVRQKYRLMVENAYRFFRGTCHLFYEDLHQQSDFPHRSPHVWGCGDLHLENFGSYKAANRFVYFDQNDFDEAQLLPATWEMARVLTSIVVAFETLKIKEENVLELAQLFLDTYCKILTGGKAKHMEERLAKGIVLAFLDQVEKRKGKAWLHKMVMGRRDKCLLLLDGEKRLDLKDKKGQLLEHFAGWLNNCPNEKLKKYKIIDACHRTAGTGSVGVSRFVLLLQNTHQKAKHLLLDMKQARPSALSRFNPVPQPQWTSEAERVAAIQSRSQYATTALLSTIDYGGVSYVVQELQPEEDKFDFTLIIRHRKDVYRVLKDMAMLTASSHLRSAGRQGSAIADELIAFGHDQAWQPLLLNYAKTYTAQVRADYHAFRQDIESGLLKA